MPAPQRIVFPNADGIPLSAALIEPAQGKPRAYALFAHCFTCGKNNAAASRISRTLAAHGIAVLRFDFTGLGDSEGDFANTSFSSNLTDLVAAADYLREHYQAPALLIGHSLGGAAVLAAANAIPESKAVVTIAAPAEPRHLERHIKTTPSGPIFELGGREFPLAPQFVDDLQRHPITERIGALRRALLVFHAPFDTVVGIDEASAIFGAAKHPKSFVSLHDADHLLSRLGDAQYVADTLSAWVQRYLPPAPISEEAPVAGGAVRIAEANQKFLREVVTDDHAWLADEPRKVGGENLGPDPYEHLLAALGTCTSMTVRMYANRKKWPLTDIDITLTHRREHITDCEDCTASDGRGERLDILHRQITLHGPALSAEQRARLLEIADRCPVHRTLEGELRITTEELAIESSSDNR